MDTSQDFRAGAGGAPPGRSTTGEQADSEGIGTLISGVIKDLQELMRAELRLAQTELKEDATAAGRAIAVIAVGALIGLVGFIFLMLAVTYLPDRWVSQWVRALIVGAALLVIALILALNGKGTLSAASLKPEQTIETLKEDQQWAKQQINSVKR